MISIIMISFTQKKKLPARRQRAFWDSAFRSSVTVIELRREILIKVTMISAVAKAEDHHEHGCEEHESESEKDAVSESVRQLDVEEQIDNRGRNSAYR